MSVERERGAENKAFISAYKPASNPWFVVGLLCALYGISFIDRMILALLVDPIRQYTGASDSQIALLMGAGFAFFYVVAGIPLAHLADRRNRVTLLVSGVLLWSLTTLAAAFSQNFASLAIARAGVAIGEAVLTPVAVSMIADLFSAPHRALPTSLYSTAGAVMGAGSLIFGAAAVALASSLTSRLGIPVWRLTFAIVSIPGLIVAIVFGALVKDPTRQEASGADPNRSLLRSAIRYFGDNLGLYLPAFVGVGSMLSVAMGLAAWGPTMLAREHGFSPATAGMLFGGAASIGSALGTLSTPATLSLIRRKSPLRGWNPIFIAAILYALVAAPAVALTISSRRISIVLVGVALGMAALAASALLPLLLVQEETPHWFRARAVAAYLFINALVAIGLGPLAVVWLSGRNPGSGLAGGLSHLAWLALLPALLCYFLILAKESKRPRG